MLNKDLINHKFPGGSFTVDKEINNLIKSSTGLEISKTTSNEYLVHPIFSMVALNSIGSVSYTHLTLPTKRIV